MEAIDTLPTIIMEFIEDCSLADVIADGFTDREFRSMAAQLVSGLAAAHEQGIRHGDFKPANVLLRNRSYPVLVDFGLAQLIHRVNSAAAKAFPSTDLASSSVREDAPPDPDQTIILNLNLPMDLEGEVADPSGVSGTPAFMSPEQARGQVLSEASDIFSLGLILIQMLFGKSPMDNMSVVEIITALRTDDFVYSLIEKLDQSYRAELADLFSLPPENRPSANEIHQRMA